MLALLLAALGTRGAVVVHFGAGMVTRGSCVPCGRRVRVPPSALCSTAAGGSSSASNLNREMLEIAAPALLGLAIDPVASLVDTAFVGHYCTPAELAGAGVSISVFNLLSRTFNFIGTSTTSRVASVSPETAPGEFTEAMASEAAGSLAVAVTVGVALTLAMTAGGGSLLRLLGVGRGSDLAQPARRYLAARALSAPAALSLMALQGAFRGARDTRTPLAALALASALNVALDPLMIVTLNGGVAGAALATTVSQYAAAALLWRRLARACDGISTASGQWMGLPRPPLSRCTNIFRAGSWLTVRTFVLSGTLSVASGAAAAAGVVAGAAHLVCFQLWMAVSLLADAIAVAAQAMLVPAPHPLPHTSRSPSHLTLTLTSHPHPQTSPSPSHLTLTLTSHPSLLTHHAHPHISPSPSHLTLHSSNITLTLTSHPHPHISPSLLTHHPHPHISPLPFTHYPHSSHIILTLTHHAHPHISPFTPHISPSPSHLTLTLTSHAHPHISPLPSHLTLALTHYPHPHISLFTPHTSPSPFHSSHFTLALTLVAAQALLAAALSRRDGRTARLVASRTLAAGVLIGAASAAALAACARILPSLFTPDAAVLAAAATIWPIVAGTQPLNTLAFAVDGLLFGASDFRFCAEFIVLAATPAVGLMLWSTSARAGPLHGLGGVWGGLGLFMGLRAVLGTARIFSGRGPWHALASNATDVSR